MIRAILYPRRALIVVTYYLKEAGAVERLVESFEAALGVAHDLVIVVENGSPLGVSPSSRFVHMAGDNSRWEFSAMAAGLRFCATQGDRIQSCTVINDSFGRNWAITSASRSVIRRMYDWASAGGIAGWQDIFTPLHMPPFSQKPNSRILVAAENRLAAVAGSIEAAIGQEEQFRASAIPLFNAHHRAVLNRWNARNTGRWSAADLANRDSRIFIEHHFLDSLNPDEVRLFPRTWLGGLAYSVRRRLASERR